MLHAGIKGCCGGSEEKEGQYHCENTRGWQAVAKRAEKDEHETVVDEGGFSAPNCGNGNPG